MPEKRATVYHLAQANIGRMRGLLDAPVMEGFVAQLEHINAVADASPGFVWRLQTEAGDATALRVFEDPLLLINLSVWETLEALYDYVYRSDHLGPVRDRRQWFERPDGPHLVLWWIPRGTLPTAEEARARLERLAVEGPSPEAFTFKHRFGPPGAGPAPLPLEVEDWEWAT
jgi:hypothetical protein